MLNDSLIYAVGEMYLKDSSGAIDPILYNLAVWNGHRWDLRRVPYHYPGGVNYSTMLSTNSVTVFSGARLAWIDHGFDSIWGEVAGHALSDVRILATSGSLIVAGTYSDGVWISTGNTGEEWQKASVGLPDGIISSLFIGESDLFNDMGESFLRKPLSEVLATVSPNARGVPLK